MKKIRYDLILLCLIMVTFFKVANAQIAVTLDVQSTVPADYFGYNAANLVRPTSPNFDTQWLIDSLDALNSSNIRYPAGTISNYWDWQTGFFDQNLPNGWILPKDFKDNAYRNMDFNKLKTMVDRMGVPPIFCMNLVTKDKYFATAGLMFSKGLNLPTKYLEFGNEIYNDIPLYEERYPTTEDYIADCNNWASYIKSVPGMSNVKIAVVGSTDRYPIEPLVSRKNRWTGVVSANANQYIDAVTLHNYLSVSLGTKAIETNVGLALSSALRGTDNLNDELIAIGNAGKEAWITEYNLFERNKCANEGFFHGLFASAMTLSMLQSPVITRVVCHSLVGTAESAAIYDDNLGLDLKGSYNNNINCAPNPIPETKVHEKTALGVCMQLVGDGLKNADVKRKLIFSNPPKLTVDYDALIGYWFDGKLSTDMVILNMDSTDRTITIASSVFNVTNGKYIMVSPGPGGVLEPVKGDAKLNPGTYECKTSGIQNATQTMVLKKYSVTHIYVMKASVKITATEKSICSGTNTSVVVKGGSGYTWNNTTLVPVKADNSVMKFNAPTVTTVTNYKLKVTTAQGYTDSVYITVNPKPVLTVSASATQVCKGSPVNLTATLTGGNAANSKSFIWFPSQYIVKADTAKAIANPTKSVVFKCFASDGVCFAMNDSVPLITVVPIADAGSDVFVCDDSLPVTISANQLSGTSTYKWYDNTGSLVKTGTSAQVAPTEPTTYMLVVNNGGNACKDTAYVSVHPFTCCQSISYPTQLTFNPGDKLLDNFIPRLKAFCLANPGHGYCNDDTLMNFNDEILFNGDFFCNTNFTFLNCSNIHFADESKFNFHEGVAKIKFINCTLEAGMCSNRMWNGFYMADFGAELTLDNCFVNDCENIIQGYVDPSLYISNTRFDRFYKGIYLSESSYDQQGWFYGNIFTQSATLKYPHSGKKSLYAFKLDNYKDIQIGDSLYTRNYYNNLQYGIISINTNLFLYNNKFFNITAWDAADSTNGTAVYLVNSFGFGNPSNPLHLYPELYFKAGIEFNSKPNKFDNCTYGIYAVNARCEIKGSVFNNTKNAIELVGLTSKRTFVNRNSIVGSDVGVDFIEPKLSELNINNNNITTNNQVNGNLMTPGLRVLDAAGQASTLLIKSNVINSGGTHGYYFINGRPNFSFADNKVYMTNSNTSFKTYGYRFENMDSLTFKCNLAKANYADSIANKVDASFSFCANASVQCNTFDNASKGIEFLGNCNNLTLKNNDFKYLTDGLVIGAVGQTGGVIGPQPVSSTGAPVRNMFLGQYISTVNGPNKSKGVFGHAATYAINSICAGTKGDPRQFFSQYNDSLTVPYPNLKTGTNSSAITPYYQTKLGNSCNVSCLLPNPVRMGQSSTTASDANEEDNIENINKDYDNTINNVIPSLTDEATAWSVKSEFYNSIKLNTSEIVGKQDVSDFYNSISNSNIAYISNLNELVSAINGAGSNKASFERKLKTVIALNEALIPENVIEKTFKDFNALYFKTMGGYNLSATEIKALSKIAHQCPYINGTAVFNARSLYANYSRFENYDDELNCQGKYELSKDKLGALTSEDIDFGLYPNPNNGQFNLRYDLTRFSNATIIFYDLVGKQVQQIQLDVNSDKASIDLQNLVGGLYTYVVYSNDKQLNHGKVTVIK